MQVPFEIYQKPCFFTIERITHYHRQEISTIGCKADTAL